MKPGGADRAFRAGEAAGAGGARETGARPVFSARFGPGGAVRPAALRFTLMEEALMIRREAGKQPYLGGRM